MPNLCPLYLLDTEASGSVPACDGPETGHKSDCGTERRRAQWAGSSGRNVTRIGLLKNDRLSPRAVLDSPENKRFRLSVEERPANRAIRPAGGIGSTWRSQEGWGVTWEWACSRCTYSRGNSKGGGVAPSCPVGHDGWTYREYSCRAAFFWGWAWSLFFAFYYQPRKSGEKKFGGGAGVT